MKGGSSAREAAKAAAVPVYAIKSPAHAVLVKALGKLAKLQDSPPEPAGVLYQNHVVSRVTSFHLEAERQGCLLSAVTRLLYFLIPLKRDTIHFVHKDHS